jgi:hypothetical protein
MDVAADGDANSFIAAATCLHSIHNSVNSESSLNGRDGERKCSCCYIVEVCSCESLILRSINQLCQKPLVCKIHHACLYYLLHSPPCSALYFSSSRQPSPRGRYTPKSTDTKPDINTLKPGSSKLHQCHYHHILIFEHFILQCCYRYPKWCPCWCWNRLFWLWRRIFGSE